VSSAKVAIVVLLVVGKSAVYSRYNNGPSPALDFKLIILCPHEWSFVPKTVS
jgi:hypothetical protein